MEQKSAVCSRQACTNEFTDNIPETKPLSFDCDGAWHFNVEAQF